MKNIFKTIFRHKVISAIIIILVVAGGYLGYKRLNNKEGVRYVLAAVQKGTIVVSVSGTGQVSASDQIDIKPRVSGDVTYLGVKEGQNIKAGTLLVKLDTSDIEETIEEAEKSLEEEKFNLEKMKGITTDEGTLRGEKEKAEDDLQKAYEDGFNNVTNVFLELPNLMSGLHDILFSSDFSSVQENTNYYTDAVKSYDDRVLQYQEDTISKYNIARKAYDQNFEDYKSASRFSETGVVESLINQTYETTKDIAEAVKSINNLIQFYQDELIEHNIKPQTLSDTHLATLNTYTGKTNNFLLTLLSTKNSIQSNKETLIEADLNIEDQEEKVEEAEKTLEEAKEKLADYSVFSSISGIITNIQLKKGDSVSTGTTIATIITSEEIAEITLNEVDVAKVKVGQKATLTFDAFEDASITGKVLSVDTVGKASQGVVSYGVKTSLDTEDEKVKPGMSVTADIITGIKQDVLVLPNSVVKSQGNSKYVESVEASDDIKQKLLASVSEITLPSSPKQQSIETGLSSDSYTEIVSGLKEGDIVVSSTIGSSSSTSTSTRNSQNQGFQIMEFNSGGGPPR